MLMKSSTHLKQVILLLALFLSTHDLYAQVSKCKATGLSFKTKNENTDRWSAWSDMESVDILITIDVDNERIKIFSKKEQVYDIIQSYKLYTDDDGDDVLKFQCVNEDGLKCMVRLLRLNSQNGKRQLYVGFADMLWVYNIYFLDN